MPEPKSRCFFYLLGAPPELGIGIKMISNKYGMKRYDMFGK